MTEPWEDDGAWGLASRVPSNEWFPVNTATGEWQLPGQPTLASSAGMPDVTAPPGRGGTPDQAPLAIGQVAGTLAPPMTIPASMARVARADQAGLLTPQPSVWETMARAVGMATPTGRAILQGFDQQQQQGLQNRMALRRQHVLEDQEARQATQTSLETLRKISEMPNKTMRNLMFDRYVADMGSSGQPLPTDMVEAFKKSSLDEGKQMAAMLTPMFEAAGIDPTTAGQILQEGGDPQRLLEMIDMGLKATKQKADEAEEARLTQSRQTLFGASTGAGTPTTPTESPQANVGRREATPSPNAPMPIRMNNPLNIKQGRATQKWVDQGVAVPGDEAQDGGRFLKFQSPSQGVQAAQDLLTGPTYSGLSVDAALKKWSNNGYGGDIVSGVDSTKKIADLTPEELQRTMGAMIKREGGAPALAADTRMQVAGPGAPGADQAQLTRLNQQIAAMDQFLAATIGSGRERTKGMVNEVQQERTRLTQERDKLVERGVKEREQREEPQRALAKETALQPLKKELAEAQRALTPIDRMTQQSIATNKSVYRSIGKIEEYLREGTDLPADFVNLVAQDTPGISAWLQSDPKNITGLAKQWETKFKAVAENDPRANRFLAALGNMRDLVIRERSGGSVTGNELDRAMGAFMGSLPNINQAFSLFAQNLANVKETVMDELVTAGAAARPLSGGKAMYGTLPKEIRDRIDYAERGEEYPKAQMPVQARPKVTGPIQQVAP